MNQDQVQIQIDAQAKPRGAQIRGVLNRHTVTSAFGQLEPVLRTRAPLAVNLGQVTAIDSAGIALLAHALRRLGNGPQGLTLVNASPMVTANLKLAGWDVNAPMATGEIHVDGGWVAAVGDEAERVGHHVHKFALLVSEIVYRAVVRPLRGEWPRAHLVLEQLARIGAGSAPIVLVVALLVGLTTAFQAVYQLRQFGANIYIADLVGISMMRELGPLMAAILVAGRSGSAITAEIGTMKVSEEIDALTLFGINPISYLAVPRVYAVILTQAMLGVLSGVTGILGGYIIGAFALGLSTQAYVNRTLQALTVGDVMLNISKSAVFGMLIVVAGIYYGLEVSGGAAGVGRATTRSVVTAIFLIIIADCVFSFV